MLDLRNFILKNLSEECIVYIHQIKNSYGRGHTPVCTTEMIAFAKACTYFKNLDTELLGLSIDSNASHLALQKVPTKNLSNHLH